jgi:muconolactone delta-isomerase
MKVLALEKELIEGSSNKTLMELEAQRVYELYKKDKIRQIYFQKQKHTTVIVLEVEDISEARNIISSLPLVENKIIEFDLIELIPYNGLDRIIDQKKV